MLWVDEFTPKNCKEWIGNPSIKSQLKNYLSGNKIVKCIILEGSPGNGKTSLVYAMANELNKEVIEINASDERGKNDMIRLTELAYMGDKSKILLIDEADGIRSWNELTDLIKKAPCNVIITCNDISRINKNVIKMSLPITISYPPVSIVADRLKCILYLKGLNTIKDTDIVRIAEKCTNVRSAIYTLQQFTMGRMKKIEPLDTEMTIDDKMKKLFTGEEVYLTNTEYNKVEDWALANKIELKQIVELSMLRAIGKEVSDMQDLIRIYCDNMRGKIVKIKQPRWRRW